MNIKMPTREQFRLQMGELSPQEVRIAQAAYRLGAAEAIRAAVGGEAVAWAHKDGMRILQDDGEGSLYLTSDRQDEYGQTIPLYASPPATAQAVAWVSSEAASLLRKLPSCAAAFRSFDVNAASVKRDDRSVPIYLQPPATVDVGAMRRALTEYPDKNPQQSQAHKVCAGVLKLAASYAGEER